MPVRHLGAVGGEAAGDWHELVFLHAGSFLIYSRGCKAVVDSNWLLCFDPQRPYRTAHPFGCGDRGSSLAIGSDLLSAMLRERFDQEPGEVLLPLQRALVPTRLYARQRLLVRTLAGGPPEDRGWVEQEVLQLVEEAIAGALGEGEGAPATSVIARPHRELTEAALSFIQERFAGPLTIVEVADALGVSRGHLARIFRRVAGLPIHRYLNRLRLRVALDAVQRGASDLLALALDLGYDSHSHFSTAFRQEYGIAPSRLRDRGAPAERVSARRQGSE